MESLYRRAQVYIYTYGIERKYYRRAQVYICTSGLSDEEKRLINILANDAYDKLYAFGWRMEEDGSGTYYTDGGNTIRISIHKAEDENSRIVLLETYGESPLSIPEEFNLSYYEALRGR